MIAVSAFRGGFKSPTVQPRKSFQSDEEWRLFYCGSTLGCRVTQGFDLCNLDDL